MTGVLKRVHGMNIVGQGGKIILFMLPLLVAAILVHVFLPRVAALPRFFAYTRVLGYLLLVPGLLLWGAAVYQLLAGFPRGKLLTKGAYGVVRNPIYASVTLFILPGIAFITQTWVYFVPAAFLYAGVMLFIRKEERQLLQVFGEDYEHYMARVHRLIPYRRPDPGSR